MHSRQLEHAVAPKEVAIGVGQDGKFRTAAHKEYPPQFCDALAGTLIDQIDACRRQNLCRNCTEMDPDLVEWMKDAEAQRSAIRSNATWLPDYQGS